MRISTQMMYEQNMRGVTNAQGKWLGYGEQMTTGQRVNRPSDDPIAASQAVVISQAQAQNTQYDTARTLEAESFPRRERVAAGNYCRHGRTEQHRESGQRLAE